MYPARWFVLLTIAGMMIHLPAPGQESQRDAEPLGAPTDSLQQMNSARILFDKNLNTFNWIGGITLDTTFGRTRVGLSTLYLSNIILVDGALQSSQRSSESAQQTITMLVDHALSAPITIRGAWSSLVYSDNKAVGLSNASSHTALAGFALFPLASLSVIPLAGYRWDSQGDIRNRGLALDLGAALDGINLDGYMIRGNARYKRDDLDPRLMEHHQVYAGVQKAFGPFSRDSLMAAYSHVRRDFYLFGDSAIESRTDRIFSFANLLEYDMTPALGARAFVSISNRGLDKDSRRQIGDAAPTAFDSHIDEFRFETFLETIYRSPGSEMQANLRVGYAERDETHRLKAADNLPPNLSVLLAERNRQEQTKDNTARRVVLAGGVIVPVSASDRVTFSGSAAILRYDTPSEANLEDRDELLIAATVGSRHRLTPVLDVGITLDGTFSHLVYLLKERSANNNINRVLRLTPRLLYDPAPWFATMNAFEVLANYTVYDFEQEVALARSFSYRQFSWIDSTRVELTGRIGLDFYAYLKLYERGLLRWDEFKERTENSTVDRTFSGQVRFSPGQDMLFAIGIRYFSQSRYVFKDAQKSLDTFFSSVGPTCLIRWDIGSTSRLLFRGWYERRKQSDGTIRSLASMTMHLYVHF